MTVKVSLELIHADRDLKALGEPQVQECAHSWVEQMAQYMLCYLSNAAVANIQDLGGINRTGDPGLGFKFNAVFSSDLAGIQVGSSATAPDRDDFELTTRILDGNTAGRLEYTPLTSTVSAFVAVTGGYRLTLEQSYLNDSGGSITVRETGLYTLNRDTAASSFICMLHDLVSPAFTVVDGGAMIVRYHLDWLV